MNTWYLRMAAMAMIADLKLCIAERGLMQGILIL